MTSAEEPQRRLRTLLFSTLYPSEVRPGHGIFVETRLRELLKTDALETRVLAPVPWFPFKHPRFGDRARIARTAKRERRHDIEVLHPRYPLVPKLGMSLAPLLLAAAALPVARKLLRDGFDFDLIDAHYFYPDGVAAVLLGTWLHKPVVITARGSDVNLIADYAVPRRWMRWAADRAQALIGVSGALVQRMAALGMPASRLHLLRNGVDLQRFLPLDVAASRQRIGHTGGPLLLSVGNLVALKGHDLCIDLLGLLRKTHPGAQLLIAGDGPLRGTLQAHASARGLAGCVHFAGSVPNTELAHWYSAADVLMLASSREGWPNVLLESMACGTPAVATNVGGIPEIICAPAAGRVVAERNAEALASAVSGLLSQPPSREEVRRHAEAFSWDDTSRGQLALFRSQHLRASPRSSSRGAANA